MHDFDLWFDEIASLVKCHSPSGVESEMDAFLLRQLQSAGLAPVQDASGNIILKIEGQPDGGTLAITAHKDEIGTSVTAVEEDGRVRVQKLGGGFPWVYGEGGVDLLGEKELVSGVLCFGSRHVTHASPQQQHKESAPVKWSDTWIETKMTRAELDAAGVRPGTRAVVGRARKQLLRLKDHVASYTIDNRASLAILLRLARRLKAPKPTVYLVASAKEEMGALGALYFARTNLVDAMVALDICPLADEYSVVDSEAPVLLSEDSHSLYDMQLNNAIRRAAESQAIPLQIATVRAFGSDASIATKFGHLARGACLSFPTQNTHGYEIASLPAIANCALILEALCEQGIEC